MHAKHRGVAAVTVADGAARAPQGRSQRGFQIGESLHRFINMTPAE
jgi:hypothetical protein